MEKKKVKIRAKLLIVLGVIVGVFGGMIIGFIAYFRIPMRGYYKASEKAFVIPGCNDGFVAQGMHYDEERNHFIVSGYQNDGAASPLYIVDKESGRTEKKVELLKADGSDFKGHAGGVAAYGDYVYVAGGDARCLYVYSYSELLEAENGAGIFCKGKVSLKASDEDYLDVSFVSVYDGKIVVGEFYRSKGYPTLGSHKLTTAAGDYNQALAVEFALSDSAKFGVDTTPLKAYSLTDQIQGMCFADGKIYLSSSYALAFSHIYEYDESKAANEGTIAVLGKEIPLYALDSASLIRDYKIPPMSEEIVMVDGKLYVMCESASNKYVFGKFTGGKYCYATDLSKF